MGDWGNTTDTHDSNVQIVWDALNATPRRATVCDTCGALYDGHHRCDPFGHPAEDEPDNDYPYLKGWR